MMNHKKLYLLGFITSILFLAKSCFATNWTHSFYTQSYYIYNNPTPHGVLLSIDTTRAGISNADACANALNTPVTYPYGADAAPQIPGTITDTYSACTGTSNPMINDWVQLGDPFNSQDGQSHNLGTYPLFVAAYVAVNNSDHLTTWYFQPILTGYVSDSELKSIRYYSGSANLFVNNDSDNADFDIDGVGSHSNGLVNNSAPNIVTQFCQNVSMTPNSGSKSSVLYAQCPILNLYTSSYSGYLPNWSSGAKSQVTDAVFPGIPYANDTQGNIILVPPGDYAAPTNNCYFQYWNGNLGQLSCNADAQGHTKSFVIDASKLSRLSPNQVYFLHVTHDANYNYSIQFVPVWLEYAKSTPYGVN